MNALIVGLAVAAAVLSAGFTGLLRRYALRTQLLDLPNERSSHVRPTPRGGGLAIVLTLLPGLVVLWLAGALATKPLIALLVGGGLIAAISFLDDRHNLPARWRFLVHLLAAAWAVAWLGVPALPVAGLEFELGVAGLVLAVVAIVWLLNLYNFMDGIDGIAGIEAITVAGGAALLLLYAGHAAAAAPLALVAAATAGFLIWNWPPAKIFMGDVGSAFLGFIFGAFALATSGATPLNLWVWAILLAVFITDATVTLLRRLLRGERWYEAHRSHAYQRLSRRFQSHRKVTVAVGLINLLWLLPLACIAMTWPPHGIWLTILAYLPLVAVAIGCGAGRPD